jgi:hypothetical protein
MFMPLSRLMCLPQRNACTQEGGLSMMMWIGMTGKKLLTCPDKPYIPSLGIIV